MAQGHPPRQSRTKQFAVPRRSFLGQAVDAIRRAGGLTFSGTDGQGERAVTAGESFDVVVVGSGAAGAMAALRAAELGLKVLILAKAQKFGGTSATSGGVLWIPNHQLDGDKGDRKSVV